MNYLEFLIEPSDSESVSEFSRESTVLVIPDLDKPPFQVFFLPCTIHKKKKNDMM